MSLNADILIDRSYLKGQITKWRLIAIIVIALAAILLTRSYTGDLSVGGYIARVQVSGVIVDDIRRDKLFHDLAEDNSAKAVILWMDSPGGTVVGGEELYLNVKKLAAKKPVVVVMRSLATSAGYMSTVGASRIFARRGTLTGSIGVIMQTADFTGLADKLGVSPVILKSSPLKAIPNPMEKLTAEGKASLEVVIRDYYETFVDIVAENRNLPRESVLKLADGRVYTGPQALELGLIDALGGEDDAIAWLAAEKGINKDLTIRDREPEKEKPRNLSEFFGQWFGDFSFFNQHRQEGLVSTWNPGLSQ